MNRIKKLFNLNAETEPFPLNETTLELYKENQFNLEYCRPVIISLPRN